MDKKKKENTKNKVIFLIIGGLITFIFNYTLSKIENKQPLTQQDCITFQQCDIQKRCIELETCKY